MWDAAYPYIIAIAPTIGVAILFYIVIKAIIEGDRRERRAVAQWEAEHGRSIRPQRNASPAASGSQETGSAASGSAATHTAESTSGTADRVDSTQIEKNPQS